MEFGKCLLPLLWSGYGCWDLLPVRHNREFVGAEGSSCKSIHFLEVLCYTGELAQSFGLCGLTCFLSKNFLKTDADYSLAIQVANCITSDSHVKLFFLSLTVLVLSEDRFLTTLSSQSSTGSTHLQLPTSPEVASEHMTGANTLSEQDTTSSSEGIVQL